MRPQARNLCLPFLIRECDHATTIKHYSIKHKAWGKNIFGYFSADIHQAVS